jgi:hypothetical protein
MAIGFYFIEKTFNIIIDWANEEKLAPAREIVVSDLIRTYCSAFNAAYWIMDLNYKNKDFQNKDKFKGKSIYLSRPSSDLKRLKKNMQINNSALGADLMPNISTFVNSAEKLLSELKYYLYIHRDGYANFDFVTKPPFNELKAMDSVSNSLRKNYEKLFKDKKIYYPEPKTYLEIIQKWEDAAEKTGRLFYDPTVYEAKKDKVIFVYGIDNLKAIPGNNIEDKVTVIVFDPHHG